MAPPSAGVFTGHGLALQVCRVPGANSFLQCHCSSLLAGAALEHIPADVGETDSMECLQEHPCPWQWGRDLSKNFPALLGFCSIRCLETFPCELEVSSVNSCSRPRPAAFYSALNPPKSSFVVVLQGQCGDSAVTCHLWDIVDSD